MKSSIINSLDLSPTNFGLVALWLSRQPLPTPLKLPLDPACFSVTRRALAGWLLDRGEAVDKGKSCYRR